MYGLFLIPQKTAASVNFASKLTFLRFLFIYLINVYVLYRHHQTVHEGYEVFKFSLETGTSSLRTHLFTHHLDIWVDGCDKFKIDITAQNAQGPVAAYRERKWQGGTLPEGSGRPDDLGEFSHEAFVDAITQFIIADDQVWIFSHSKIIISDLFEYLVVECH